MVRAVKPGSARNALLGCQRAPVPGDLRTSVQRHRLQLHLHAQPVQTRHAGRSRPGSAPVLAAGGNKVFPRLALLPLQYVHTDLP